jgi:hypothetical protein
LAERNREGSIDVLERHARTIFLQRRHLLPQSEVLDHKIGAPPTYRAQSAGADRDEENKDTEHDGGILHSLSRISSGIQVLDFTERTGFDEGHPTRTLQLPLRPYSLVDIRI